MANKNESFAEAFGKVFGALVMFIAAVIVIAPLGVLFGAIAGWTVSLFFGDMVLDVLRTMGLSKEVTMWQLGGSIGFLSSFLRTKVSPSK